ncbi:hypothetical protein C8R43DRAFT_1125706 [Mycena crocata]|nr:hypothetical protein C8R43DRAFT_1125706 [Mycena crocata]
MGVDIFPSLSVRTKAFSKLSLIALCVLLALAAALPAALELERRQFKGVDDPV